MLLYSTLLSINYSLTKEKFIKLVIKWNQTSKYKENIIENIDWNGERNIRFGNDRLSLTIEEYSDKNIIAVRYEKIDDDGAVWDTDYIMNFNDMRMAIQLDRSYKEEALFFDAPFSTPHFITLLIEEGYLRDDGILSVTNKPLMIGEDNLSVLIDIINGNTKYKLPVVFVSKTIKNEDPIDIGWLSSRIKGIAHVLLQEDVSSGEVLKDLCDKKNEYFGAVGIYYPKSSVEHKKFLYHRDNGYDPIMLEKIVRNVINYSNIRNVDSLYTWQGVTSAILDKRFQLQSEQRLLAEEAKGKAEIEVEKVYDAFDDDIRILQQRVDELSKANEVLRYENNGLREKLTTTDVEPVILSGEEDEFYPGEIKDIVLSALIECLKNTPQNSRREDIIKDIIQSNDYKNLSGERQERVKKILKGFNGMTKVLRQELIDMGFEIADDTKHYKLTYYGDSRYGATLAKTPSDHRDGKNAASVICRDML